MLRSATAKMLPPRPPSPPSGPPLGMNFSRRKLATPLPPLPATTSMVASSTNFMKVFCLVEPARQAKKPPRCAFGLLPHEGAFCLGAARRQKSPAACDRAFAVRVTGCRYPAVTTDTNSFFNDPLRLEEHTSELQQLM